MNLYEDFKRKIYDSINFVHDKSINYDHRKSSSINYENQLRRPIIEIEIFNIFAREARNCIWRKDSFVFSHL